EKSESNNKLRSSAGPLRSAGLGDGYAYRVFLYESGALAASELFASGTPGSIAVEKAKTYEWLALSYNSTDVVPVADGDGMVNIQMRIDVLYTSGTFEVATDYDDVVVSLSITFNQKLSCVDIELITMGMFALINSASITV